MTRSAAARILAWLGPVLLIPVLAGAPALAGEPFTVTAVAIDATAEDAMVAKASALAEGKARAFRRLLEKLTLERHWARLPRPTAVAIEDMVQGFEVADERRSQLRYLADLTVRFKPEPVRALLRGARIPFAETASAPIVVLPIFQYGSAARLWDDPNPWRDAWLGFEIRHGLVDLVIPIGELSDVVAIDALQALAGEPAPLRRIAERHGADSTLVATARPNFDLATGVPSVTVTLRRGGAETEVLFSERITGAAGSSAAGLLPEAVAQVARRIDDDWKAQNLLAFDRPAEIVVVVPLDGLESWLQVRRRLERLRQVRSIEVISLSRQEGRLRLHYLGDEPRLTTALALTHLTLSEVDGRWTLRPAILAAGTDGGKDVAAPDIAVPAGDPALPPLPALLSDDPVAAENDVPVKPGLDELLVE
ncbi:MAG: DUF2066 domain-containing protein [Alphaproteobacteria bacterium]|nr:DUF2066 domain-containing protein [Alphaproteobacteria bacterium]